MKTGELRSLGHNIADSLASGIGLMIGVYDVDVFAEAAAGPEGFIIVNFLDGTTFGSPVSVTLQRAIHLYREALPALCDKHRIVFSGIKTLNARFGTDQVYGRHFAVTVESAEGKKATDQYVGTPGRRLRRVRSSCLKRPLWRSLNGSYGSGIARRPRVPTDSPVLRKENRHGSYAATPALSLENLQLLTYSSQPDIWGGYPDTGNVLIWSLETVGRLTEAPYVDGEASRPKMLDLAQSVVLGQQKDTL
jgi:hypothetical protein